MKHIIKFTLPEETTELLQYQAGVSLTSIIWNFDQILRTLERGDDTPLRPSTVRMMLREQMDDITFENRIFE